MKTKPKNPWIQLEHFTFTNGEDVDRTIWQSPQWISPTNNPSFLGQTALRNFPDFGTLGYVPVINNAAQLYLSTYNPLSNTYQSQQMSFLGAQIGTINKWGLTSYKSVAFETEVVLPITGADAAPEGVVASLFAYNLITTVPFLHDEIDFEIASNFWQDANEQINTNVYVVTGNSMSNYDKVVSPTESLSGTVVLRIEWSMAGVNWYINKDTNPNPIYSEKYVPLSNMSLVLNFWVPGSGWNWAFSSGLSPAYAPGEQWTYQVNWAKVWVINN